MGADSAARPGALVWWGLTATLVVGLVALDATALLLEWSTRSQPNPYQATIAMCAGALFSFAPLLLGAGRVDPDMSAEAFPPREPYSRYAGRHLLGVCLACAPLWTAASLHLLAFFALGHVPWTAVTFAGLLAVGLVHQAILGIVVRLFVRERLLAILALIGTLLLELVAPLVCCLPSFNLALSGYFLVSSAPSIQHGSAAGMAVALSACSQGVVMLLAAGAGWMRYRALQERAREVRAAAELRATYRTCQHCGERIPPASNPCRVCGEPDPFASPPAAGQPSL